MSSALTGGFFTTWEAGYPHTVEYLFCWTVFNLWNTLEEMDNLTILYFPLRE